MSFYIVPRTFSQEKIIYNPTKYLWTAPLSKLLRCQSKTNAESARDYKWVESVTWTCNEVALGIWLRLGIGEHFVGWFSATWELRWMVCYGWKNYTRTPCDNIKSRSNDVKMQPFSDVWNFLGSCYAQECSRKLTCYPENWWLPIILTEVWCIRRCSTGART